MAKLTRKIWVGIGVATLAGAGLPSQPALAQHAHQTPDASKAPKAGAATATPAEGGEAYLTDGGPKDTRIRFYRDVELIRGHLLIGQELIAAGAWDEGLPHFLHPTEELYDGLDRYLKQHDIPAFKRELTALAQAVKAKREGAYQQALKVVDPKLEAAIVKVKTFMQPPLGYVARTAAELMKVAQSEYATSIEDGRFVKPSEYQDGRGFMLRAERLFEQSLPALARMDAQAVARVRQKFAEAKKAWPSAMPPDVPIIEPGVLSALVSDIELHVSRF